METQLLSVRDQACVWHPFTQMKTAMAPIPIIKGKGCYLYAEDGSRYIDAISSWCVNLHGHAHPYISQKITEQAQQLEHVIFTDFTHYPAVNLAERLLKLLPGNLSRVFYSDNGSTAVEAACKIVFQYWHNQDPTTSRTKMICFKGAYHGDTFGAMSVAGKSGLTRPFWPFLFDVVAIDPPYMGKEEISLNQLREALSTGYIAGFIFEPLVQGVRGMVSHSLEGLSALIHLCREHQVVTIADEVLTGFGRTGSLFVSNMLSCHPDIVCLAKGLTGGFLTLAVTACTERVFRAFLSNERSHAFLHGHSYCANPLGCAAALANLDLLEQDTCTQQRLFIEAQHKRFCQVWGQHPRVKRCEVIGTILALEYQTQDAGYFNSMRDRLNHYFLSHHILLRPFGNTIYVLPPYCTGQEELDTIYSHLIFTLEEEI